MNLPKKCFFCFLGLRPTSLGRGSRMNAFEAAIFRVRETELLLTIGSSEMSLNMLHPYRGMPLFFVIIKERPLVRRSGLYTM